jgi:hypothetical protein
MFEYYQKPMADWSRGYFKCEVQPKCAVPGVNCAVQTSKMCSQVLHQQKYVQRVMMIDEDGGENPKWGSGGTTPGKIFKIKDARMWVLEHLEIINNIFMNQAF